MASGFQGAGIEDLDIYPMILHNPNCSGAVEGTWNVKQVPGGPQAKLSQLNK